MWLTPPHMNRKITERAWRDGGSETGVRDRAGLGPDAAHRDAEEASTGLVEDDRREIRPQG